MKYIRTQKLTPTQAHQLAKAGFIVSLIRLLCGEFDEYAVFVD